MVHVIKPLDLRDMSTVFTVVFYERSLQGVLTIDNGLDHISLAEL